MSYGMTFLPNEAQDLIRKHPDGADKVTGDALQGAFQMLLKNQFLYSGKRNQEKIYTLIRRNSDFFRKQLYLLGYTLVIDERAHYCGILPVEGPHIKHGKVNKFTTMICNCLRSCYSDRAKAGHVGRYDEVEVTMEYFLSTYDTQYGLKFEWNGAMMAVFQELAKRNIILSDNADIQDTNHILIISPVIMKLTGDEYAKQMEAFKDAHMRSLPDVDEGTGK